MGKEEELNFFGSRNDTLHLKNGSVIFMHPEPGSLAKTTGWVTWSAAFAVISYLERNVQILVKGKTLGDLSTGNGVVALAAAYLGAKSVICTEIPSCSTLPRENLKRNIDIKDRVLVEDFYWGEKEKVCPILSCDIDFACDLLFIAIRDGLIDELEKTLLEMVQNNKIVIFIYEERLTDKEQLFIDGLTQRTNPKTKVSEIPQNSYDITEYQNSHEESLCDIFDLPPSIRMYQLELDV